MPVTYIFRLARLCTATVGSCDYEILCKRPTNMKVKTTVAVYNSWLKGISVLYSTLLVQHFAEQFSASTNP